jgi:CxxC motif-containing protein
MRCLGILRQWGLENALERLKIRAPYEAGDVVKKSVREMKG